MPVTLGQVRIAILKTAVGAGYDLELLTQRINDRYQELLNAHPWSRLAAAGTIAVVASYATGTVAITTATDDVTLTDGSFPADLNGARIRIGTDATWYVFTRLTATTGTLDRAYEGETVTAATFTLWQPIYALPADCDIVDSILVPSQGWELDVSSQEQLDEWDAGRDATGPPRAYAPHPDSAAGLTRIELWPGPEDAEGLPVRYRTVGTYFTVQPGTQEFPAWVDTGAIVAGVEADIHREKGQLAQADRCEYRYTAKITAMFTEDCQRRAPIALVMADRWTVHRVARELDEDRVDRRSGLVRSFR